MKKSIKFGSVILAVTMAMGSFTSCADTSQTTETTAGTTVNAEAEKTDDTTTAKTGNVPKLLWWQIGTSPAENNKAIEEMNKYSKEKIGVEIDIKYSDWGEWEKKIPTIINSGESFDLMFTNDKYYASHVNLGAFADITDIIENDTPTLKTFIPDLVWEGVKIKDKIYSVPTYKDSSQTQYWVFSKDLVDELGIDITKIVTLQDLDPVLRKMKEARPNEYPLFCDQNGINSWPLGYDKIGSIEALGVNYEDKDAKVVNIYEQPEILEDLKMIHTWYKDGLINPDAPTTTELPKRRLAYSAQGFEGADAIWTALNDFNLISTKIWGPYYSTSTIQGSVNAVSSGSKYVKEAVKYLELVNTDPVMRNILAYGVEGTHYNKTAENTVEYLNDAYRPALYSQATFFTLMPVSPNPPNQYELVKKQNEEAKASPILGFVFDPSNVETEVANCKNEFDRFKYEIRTGVREPEEALKQLNDSQYSAGLQAVMDEVQKQVNEFLAK